MINLNRVLLIGHLGSDPLTKISTSGVTLTTFSVATNRERKSDEADKAAVTKTTWHRIVAFNKLGEIVGDRLRTGDKVFIEGVIDKRTFDDKDGNPRTLTEVKAFHVELIQSLFDRPERSGVKAGLLTPTPESN